MFGLYGLKWSLYYFLPLPDIAMSSSSLFSFLSVFKIIIIFIVKILKIICCRVGCGICCVVFAVYHFHKHQGWNTHMRRYDHHGHHWTTRQICKEKGFGVCQHLTCSRPATFLKMDLIAANLLCIPAFLLLNVILINIDLLNNRCRWPTFFGGQDIWAHFLQWESDWFVVQPHRNDCWQPNPG